MAVVIAPVSFLFNFILFVHTGHANLILINAPNFSFENGLNGQNHSLSDSYYLIKIPPGTFPISLPPNAICKTQSNVDDDYHYHDNKLGDDSDG